MRSPWSFPMIIPTSRPNASCRKASSTSTFIHPGPSASGLSRTKYQASTQKAQDECSETVGKSHHAQSLLIACTRRAASSGSASWTTRIRALGGRESRSGRSCSAFRSSKPRDIVPAPLLGIRIANCLISYPVPVAMIIML
jgi:hypothetical protein